MRSSIQRKLVCPMCSSPLALQVFREEGEEIMEGSFRCSCGIIYPIIGGVPRMLPPHLLVELQRDYPAFFELHGSQISVAGFEHRPETRVMRQTQEAFGYEWTWAADYHASNFADWLPAGVTAGVLFPGRVGLEVGCGAGRHAYATAGIAKEHFAVDLSRAVDSAFDRTRTLANCHVIQADVFHLPFPQQAFDYVYCLGVLQHLPNPEAGFHALARQPRPGGLLLVNVYQASRPITLFLLESVRKISARLPNSLLKPISIGAGCLDYGLFIGPWRRLRSTMLGKHLRRFVPTRIDEYAKHDFHTCVTDWFDRLACPVKKHYKREDVFHWYGDAGYADVIVTPYWKAFWNGYGKRIASAAVTTG
jgi:SAM-dependent methyltransferase/uncharacterized protein YbaR (Trm112 family)